jgi:iron complex outermembrane receptor protein
LASYSTGRRLPSIRELFGDRMFQEPNPTLRVERSVSMDAGAVLQGRLGPLRGHLEARAFRLEVDDLIRFTRTSQYTVRPDNIANAEVLGVEAGLWLALRRHAALTLGTTAMHTENQFGLELPLRPQLGLLVRPELFLFPGGVERLTLFAQVDHRGQIYLDDANRTSLPGYTRLGSGVGVELLDGTLELSLRVNNLFDAAASDLLARPLPGRELLFSVTVEEQL